jgi:hypothetical protein
MTSEAEGSHRPHATTRTRSEAGSAVGVLETLPSGRSDLSRAGPGDHQLKIVPALALTNRDCEDRVPAARRRAPAWKIKIA